MDQKNNIFLSRVMFLKLTQLVFICSSFIFPLLIITNWNKFNFNFNIMD
jgi:hypothetical protein